MPQGRASSGQEAARRKRRHRAGDDVHGRVLQKSREAAARVADDSAARRRREVFVYAGTAQRLGVRERHVAVQAFDEHGRIRRSVIQQGSRWQAATRPRLVIPVAAGDPLARCDSRGVIGDPADHVPLVDGRPEVDPDELFRPGNEMHVCVVEARAAEADRRRRSFASRSPANARTSSSSPTAMMRPAETARARAWGDPDPACGCWR